MLKASFTATKSLVALVVFGLWVSTAVAAWAHGAGYRICNETAATLQLHYIFQNEERTGGKDWQWRGTWEMKPGKCGFYFPNHGPMRAHLAFRRVDAIEKFDFDIALRPQDFRRRYANVSAKGRALCSRVTKGDDDWTSFARMQNACDDEKKAFYSLFWQSNGQTHAELKAYAETLTITGLGTIWAPDPELMKEANLLLAETEKLAALKEDLQAKSKKVAAQEAEIAAQKKAIRDLEESVFSDAVAQILPLLEQGAKWALDQRCPILIVMPQGQVFQVDFAGLDLRQSYMVGTEFLMLTARDDTGLGRILDRTGASEPLGSLKLALNADVVAKDGLVGIAERRDKLTFALKHLQGYCTKKRANAKG